MQLNSNLIKGAAGIVGVAVLTGFAEEKGKQLARVPVASERPKKRRRNEPVPWTDRFMLTRKERGLEAPDKEAFRAASKKELAMYLEDVDELGSKEVQRRLKRKSRLEDIAALGLSRTGTGTHTAGAPKSRVEELQEALLEIELQDRLKQKRAEAKEARRMKKLKKRKKQEEDSSLAVVLERMNNTLINMEATLHDVQKGEVKGGRPS